MGYKKSLKIFRERKNELSEDENLKLTRKINSYWGSPIICENCFEEVESISRNPILGQFKWLCNKCEEEKLLQQQIIEN